MADRDLLISLTQRTSLTKSNVHKLLPSDSIEQWLKWWVALPKIWKRVFIGNFYYADRIESEYFCDNGNAEFIEDIKDINFSNKYDIKKISELDKISVNGIGYLNDLRYLSCLENLTLLRLDKNNLTDITSLSHLANLNSVWLGENNISDVTALSHLTNLTTLRLWMNKITNIAPYLICLI